MSELRYENQELHLDIYYIKYEPDFLISYTIWEGEGFYRYDGTNWVKLSKDDKQEIIGMIEDFLEFIKSDRRK